MSVFSDLKHRICRFEMSPNFPVGELARWVEREQLSPEMLLETAQQVQAQLEVELEALQRCGNTSPATLIQHEYWCVYAEQVCSFYRALVDD
ncbi:hypothetical protein [Marinimicrobium locisalis]|uniref:hypothetical protein n=1 Tax=Marinimicrobium locisalis TaxID=546022 RepID=UPI003221D15E